MPGDVDLSTVGALLADPARAAMLSELLGGEPLPAGELARRAELSPSGASNHLKRLLEGGLVRAEADGRRRLYRLAGADVAAALEALGRIAAPPRVRSLRGAHKHAALRDARTCYDHLAGRVGVGVTERLVRLRLLQDADASYLVTRRGEAWFHELGVDVDEVRASRRGFAPRCLDLTERRPHLAGALGAALADAVKQRGFVRPRPGSRALRLTDAGSAFFADLGVEL